MKREQQTSGADKTQAGSETRAKTREGTPTPTRGRPLLGLQRAAGNQAVAARMAATRPTPVQRLVPSDSVVVQRTLDESLQKLAESENLNYDDLAQALVKVAAGQGSSNGANGVGASVTAKKGGTPPKTSEETRAQKVKDIESLEKQINSVNAGGSAEKGMTEDEKLDARKARLQNRLKFIKERDAKIRRNRGELPNDEESREARELKELDRQNEEAGYRRKISGHLNADERRAERTMSLKEEAGDVDTRERATRKRHRDIQWAEEDLTDNRRFREENRLDTLTEARNRKKAAQKRKRDLMWAQQDVNDESLHADNARLKMLKEDSNTADWMAQNRMQYEQSFAGNNAATANNPALAQWDALNNLAKKKR